MAKQQHNNNNNNKRSNNKAWKKRVARGELAKGAGGAICRHRPRLGRRGADLAMNRKGFLGGRVNPKKVKKGKTKKKQPPLPQALQDAEAHPLQPEEPQLPQQQSTEIKDEGPHNAKEDQKPKASTP